MIVKDSKGELFNCVIKLNDIHIWNETCDFHIDIDDQFEEYEVINNGENEFLDNYI